MSWSLAADTAYATRFLCSFGFDGMGTLVRLLEDMGGGSEFAPVALRRPFQSRAGKLHPVLAGLTVCDLGHDVLVDPIQLQSLKFPLFVVPFLAQVQLPDGQYLVARSKGFSVTLGAEGIWFDGTPTFGAHDLSITLSDICEGRFCTFSTRVQIDPPDWEALNLLSGRTFAPATEESRARGAGSDQSDND